MSVTTVGGATVITGEHIGIYRLLVLKQSILLEMAGMHRRGRSATAIVRDLLGLRRGGKREMVLEALERHIETLRAARADLAS